MSARPLLCPHTQYRHIETLIDAAIELTPADIASEPLLATLMAARKAFQYLAPLAGIEGEQPGDGPAIGPESYSPINEATQGETEPFDHWSEDRIDTACHASYQTEQMLYMLRREAGHGGEINRSLLISTVIRLKELNSVMMSLLTADEGLQTAEMSKVVFGEWSGEHA